MQAIQFREYLTTAYRGTSGAAMQTRSAASVSHRCSRVERTLGIDLDRALAREKSIEKVLTRLRASSEAFAFEGEAVNGTRDLVSAVRRYAEFLEWSSRR